ncbi:MULTISPECIES: enoyl-CoA hydratase/isomerase family protein [Bacillus]|uniref:enoyl-CoA hydratase/isomerase family protein n=1 Tax=Bacillus TaxID=1386 RepID=UPI000BB84D86|nr:MULTISPECIES: enoyl-CoA hydratase/isomerase family protein [Bacillus]
MQHQSNKTIKIIDNQNIMWFTINRPEKRNAIDFDVMDSLKNALLEVKGNKKIRGFVITGSGDRAFCSGGDLSVFHSLRTKEQAYDMLSKMGSILYDLMVLPVPTFAYLNGTAVGGGCEIASACDFRIAKQNVKVGFIQGKLGITTGWGGSSMLLERVNYPEAMQMLYSSKLYEATEAKEIGFIQHVVTKNSYGELMGKIHSQIAPSANVLRSYKMVAIQKWEASNLKQRMLDEIEQCSILWEKDEHHDAVDQFLMKE